MLPDLVEAPSWFDSALAEPFEDLHVEVDGVRVAYRAWGRRGDPAVVLVHGGAAHAGWWHHVAPHVCTGRRVLALDLSGHGSSGWRSAYGFRQWADEVRAVAAADGAHRPAVVGHSMGGLVALTAASRDGGELGGVIAVDVPEEVLHGRVLEAGPPRVRRVYASRAEVVSRFRAWPDDLASQAFVVAHVAATSVEPVGCGWSWKFDPSVTRHDVFDPGSLRPAACPVALVAGERGLLRLLELEEVRLRLGGGVPLTVIPDAGHHVMLDQPLALLAAIASIAGVWTARQPEKGR